MIDFCTPVRPPPSLAWQCLTDCPATAVTGWLQLSVIKRWKWKSHTWYFHHKTPLRKCIDSNSQPEQFQLSGNIHSAWWTLWSEGEGEGRREGGRADITLTPLFTDWLFSSQVSLLTTQVSDLQRSLTSLQEETDNTITKLRQELQDKANIVETLQQQIRMKMFMNLTTKNPMMAALADLQGKNPPSSQLLFCVQ